MMAAWSSGLAKGSREERKIRSPCKIELIGVGSVATLGKNEMPKLMAWTTVQMETSFSESRVILWGKFGHDDSCRSQTKFSV